MVLTSSPLSLTAFLAEDYQGQEPPEQTYELENGELIALPPEINLNQKIASVLFFYFAQLGVPADRIRMTTEMIISGERATVRVPDLMILSAELAEALEGASRSTVTLDMPPPCLVVEVASPGKTNLDRDYRYKRSQYQARAIAEYWIVDPMAHQVTVFTLVEGLYDMAVLGLGAAIESPFVTAYQPAVNLTVNQVLLESP